MGQAAGCGQRDMRCLRVACSCATGPRRFSGFANRGGGSCSEGLAGGLSFDETGAGLLSLAGLL